jgi:predicted permease
VIEAVDQCQTAQFAISDFLSYFHDLMQKRNSTGGVILGSSYDEARTRKINAEAEIAELELQRIKATMCFTSDVVKAWESVLHACRAKLLAVPVKMAPIVSSISDTAIVKVKLEDAIREALEELSNYNPSVDPVATGVALSSDEKEEPVQKKRGRPTKIDRLKE